MKKNSERFEFVYVENDGTVRELDKDEINYLKTDFKPTDGNRPYIKNSFEQLTPDNKLSGFISREKVPSDIEIIETDLRFLELRQSISIYDSGKIIELPVGIYSIKVLGGWNVKVGDFRIELRNRKNDKIIKPRVTNWRYQSFELGERAKKIMILDIVEYGNYFIDFKNREDLKVKPTNLLIVSSFEKEIPNRKLKVWIG